MSDADFSAGGVATGSKARCAASEAEVGSALVVHVCNRAIQRGAGRHVVDIADGELVRIAAVVSGRATA